jgi:flagellar export protein FliJ
VKRYRFRLDTVLRVRRVQEDLAIVALADATRALAAADATLDTRLNRYRETPAPRGEMSLDAMLRTRAHVDMVAASVLAAGAARVGAAEVVDVRRDELTAAATRVSALERLDERRRGEHAHEALRQEIVEVDDMVVARAGRTPR